MLDAIDATKRLDPLQAKKRLASILSDGALIFTKHARDRMKGDGLAETDVVNVLRGGSVTETVEEAGNWRYRQETNQMVVVVVFSADATEAVVITAFRKTRGKP